MNSTKLNFLAALGDNDAISQLSSKAPSLLEFNSYTLDWLKTGHYWSKWKKHLFANGKIASLKVCKSVLTIAFNQTHWNKTQRDKLFDIFKLLIVYCEDPNQASLDMLLSKQNEVIKIEEVQGREGFSKDNCYLLALSLNTAIDIIKDSNRKFPLLTQKCLDYCSRPIYEDIYQEWEKLPRSISFEETIDAIRSELIPWLKKTLNK